MLFEWVVSSVPAKCGDAIASMQASCDLSCASCTVQCNPFCLEEKKEFCASCKNLIWSGNPISRRNTSSSQIMKSFHTQIIRPQRRLAKPKPKPIYIGSPNARKLPVPECGIGHPAGSKAAPDCRRRFSPPHRHRHLPLTVYRSGMYAHCSSKLYPLPPRLCLHCVVWIPPCKNVCLGWFLQVLKSWTN